VKYSDIFKLPSLSIAQYLRKHKANRDVFLRMGYIQTLDDVSTDSKDHLFIGAMRGDAVMGTLTALSVLLDYGWKIRAPVSPEAAEKELSEILTEPIDPDGNAVDAGDIDRYRQGKERRLMDAAAALGVINRGNIPYSSGLVEAIIMRQNAGLLDRSSTASLQKEYLISRMSGKDSSVFRSSNGRNISSDMHELDLKQINYARDKYGSFADAWRFATHKIIGTALKASEHGSNIDLCM
jgi:hypothetical protein